MRTQANLKREFIAGFTTFLTMSYIVIVNPTILSTEGTGLPFRGVMTATILLAFICTFLMGAWAKLPYAVAPGMGINAFFTYSLMLGQNIPWQTAFGALFWSGVLFFFLSVTPVRAFIANSIPGTVRLGAASGIGLFLTFIGLKNAGWIIAHPITFVTFSPWHISGFLAVLGLLIASVLWQKKIIGAFLISIILVTLASLGLGLTKVPDQLLDWPDFTTLFFQLDFMGSFHLALLPAIFSIMLTDLFDSLSSIVGLAKTSGLIDKNGQPLRLKQALIIDSFATGLAGIFGTSSGTAFIESAAGIEAGGRTGWTAIFCSLFFLPCFFLSPILQMIPSFATAPVLVLVGFLMFSQSKDLFALHAEDALSAFLTLIIIPLTFSITQGLVWGMVSHVLLYFFCGRRKELSIGTWLIAGIGLGLIFIQNHVFHV
ncbi:MAG: NCS2 family permease [Bacteriovoracaceae bacterium]|nr:NCS2 family permease [Bacteriovoracaceae bacterium]